MTHIDNSNSRPQGLSARWVLLAGAIGLVAAGAIGGGLLSTKLKAQAASQEHTQPATNPKAATSTVKHGAATATAPRHTAQAVTCASCGIVESVAIETRKGTPTGVGAVAGGVLGGLVGSQFGGGDGKTAG